MDNELELKRSIKSMYYQMGAIVVLGLIFMLFASHIFRAFDDLFSADLSWLARMAKWIILAMIIMSILALRANKLRIQYSATPDSIIVRRKYFGTLRKDIYAIREVSSVSLRQSILGSHLNYGDIIVNMYRLGRTETLVLNGIENPLKSLSALENRVKNIKR